MDNSGMDNSGMDNLSNIVNVVEDWLVFKEYELNPDDNLIKKTKKFILRYRRIIGILLLIILLYIGFYCDFGQSRSKTKNEHKYEDQNENIQNGGNIFKNIGKKITNKIDMKKIEYSGEGSLSSKAKKAIGNSSIAKKISQINEAGAYNTGAYVGEKFKEFSGWLYQILFAIAISIAICMVVLPSLSFFIIGIICFFLLKSKISTFKSL